MSLELEDDEVVEDIMVMVIITIRTNKDVLEETFYSLENAEDFLDQIER